MASIVLSIFSMVRFLRLVLHELRPSSDINVTLTEADLSSIVRFGGYKKQKVETIESTHQKTCMYIYIYKYHIHACGRSIGVFRISNNP